MLPVPRQRYWIITDEGIQPLQGSLSFFVAGTSTPTEVFADPEGNVSLGTIVNMDADGYLPAVYIPDFGIKAILYTEVNAGGPQIWEQDGISDPGTSFLSTMGQTFTEGSKDVAAGYEITNDDNFVTVNEPVTDPAPIILQESAERGLPITIKNLGPTEVDITPQGVETIDGIAFPFTLPAANSPIFPTVTLLPLPSGSGYLIQSSHGIAGL